MSIIYDALQKTQLNRESKRGTTKLPSSRAQWMDFSLLGVIAVLLVMVAIAYYPRAVKHATVKPSQKPMAPVIQKVVMTSVQQPALIVRETIKPTIQPERRVVRFEPKLKTHPPIENLFSPKISTIDPPITFKLMQQQPVVASLPETEYRGKFILNGVFLSDDEKVALINNQSYHVGDTLDGMKIVGIDLNSVKFKLSNQILVLKASA